MADILISDFTDARFQAAFRLYFDELGIAVRDWDGLFCEMNASGENRAYVRLGEDGGVVGFLQFTPMEMAGWFFSEQVGFIREFWVKKECRGQGHGTALLRLTEEYFKARGVRRLLLTTDTAPAFYTARGYTKSPWIQAKNKDDVFVRDLNDCVC